MNLFQRLFGKKKVEETKPCPKPQTFRHISPYQSDSVWYEESERRKRRDSLDTSILYQMSSDSYTPSSDSDNSSSGFSGGFGGGDYSGGGSSGSWSDDSGSSYDSGSCDYSSSSD